MIQKVLRLKCERLIVCISLLSCLFLIGSCTTSKRAVKEGYSKVSPVVENQEKPARKDRNYRLHRVKSGETFQTIASRFQMTEEQIRSLNPGIKSEPHEGQMVKISASSRTEKKAPEAKKISEVKSPEMTTENIHIGLVLPFLLSENNENEDLSPQVKAALEFYQGALLALDSIENNRIHLKLQVYDSENDSVKLKKIYAYPEMKQVDLLIQPAFTGGISPDMKALKEKKIKILVPFSNQIEYVINNSSFYASTPSVNTQCTQMGAYLSQKHPKANFIIIHNGKSKERELSEIFQKSLNNPLNGHVKVVNFSASGIKGATDLVLSGTENILIVPSSDQAFVVQLLTLLKNRQLPGVITICGLPTWKKFDIIDPETLEYFKTLIFDEEHIDFKNADINTFRLQYIQKYHAEPANQAYAGYDIFRFLGAGMKKYASHFTDEITSYSYNGMHTSFEFQKPTANGGYENSHIFIFQLKNLQWDLVK